MKYVFIYLLPVFMTTSCLNEEEPSQAKVLTKHITVRVEGEDIQSTRIGKQTRMEVEFPLEGKGKLIYRYEIGDTLHAFTKINGVYKDSKLICKRLYNNGEDQSNSATFEGDISYTNENRTVYLFLGHYKTMNNNLLHLGLDDNSYDSENNNPIISSTISSGSCPFLYQYGRSYIYDSQPSLSADLNMLTSFATVKVPKDIGKISTTFVCCDVSPDNLIGFSKYDQTYFNIETGKIETKEFWYNNSVQKVIHMSPLNQSYNLLNIPVLPGNYLHFTIYISYGNLIWQSKSATFSTMVGSPDGDTYKVLGKWWFPVYSSNRNFFFGTVGEGSGGKGLNLPENGESVDFSK